MQTIRSHFACVLILATGATSAFGQTVPYRVIEITQELPQEPGLEYVRMNNRNDVLMLNTTLSGTGKGTRIRYYRTKSGDGFAPGLTETFRDPFSSNLNEQSEIIGFNDSGQFVFKEASPGALNNHYLVTGQTYHALGVDYPLPFGPQEYVDRRDIWLMALTHSGMVHGFFSDRLATPPDLNRRTFGQWRGDGLLPEIVFTREWFNNSTRRIFSDINANGAFIIEDKSGASAVYSVWEDGVERSITPGPLPGGVRYMILNTKGDILCYNNTQPYEMWLHLPTARYGLPEGLNAIATNQGSSDLLFSNNGHLVIRSTTSDVFRIWMNGAWNDIRLLDPSINNPPQSPGDGVRRIVQVNDAGDMLAYVRRNGEAFTRLVILERVVLDPTPTIIPAFAPDTGFDLAWASRPGKVYDLVTSTDFSTPVEEWPVHADYADVPATGATTTLTDVPVDGPLRFFAVVAADAPLGD